MPPILIAFFIMLGAGTGIPFVKGVVTPKDPAMRTHLGKPSPQEYRTWTNYPRIAVADQGRCNATFFALATRNRVTRLVAGGVEQGLDNSWSFARSLKAGERRTIAFEFLNPVGGDQLACHEESLSCYSPSYGVADSEVREGRCRSEAAEPKRKGGKQHLKGYVKPFVMFNPAIGGAYVDVEFEIVGDVTEEWYCPAIIVTWPDDTRSKAESDCPPFAERDPEARFKWPPFNHGFTSGEWPVKACIEKSGKQLACEVVTVRVLGDQAGSPTMGDAQNQ